MRLPLRVLSVILPIKRSNLHRAPDRKTNKTAVTKERLLWTYEFSEFFLCAQGELSICDTDCPALNKVL